LEKSVEWRGVRIGSLLERVAFWIVWLIQIGNNWRGDILGRWTNQRRVLLINVSVIGEGSLLERVSMERGLLEEGVE
jgi:hypothetical protein